MSTATPTRKKPGPKKGTFHGCPMEVLDLLEITGGWWTLSEIVDRLAPRYEAENIKRAVWRLARAGKLRRRLVSYRNESPVDVAQWAAQP